MEIDKMNSFELLRLLCKERGKYTKSNRELMEIIVDKLIEIGVYPKIGLGCYSALDMVENWGIDWHQFNTPHFCPNCGKDLRDWKTGPPIKREICIKEPYAEDYFICPDCKENITDSIQNYGKHAIKE